MRLEFIYLPVPDLQGALALYRDKLGFDELWREGDATAGLALPGSEAGLMVDAAAAPGSAPGPMFSVDSVDGWLAEHGEGLELVFEPSDIPDGRLLAFRDTGGNHVYVLDQSTAATA
jgi:catechol 2,3-dioxygenase-like lactoylglutathione lyase family enzyme